MNLNQFLALKNKVESLRRKADEAKGARDQLQKQLQNDYGCGTLDEAKKLLIQLNKEKEKLEKEYEEGMAEFKKKWGDKL